MTIAASTAIGTVELTVADLDAQTAFYREAIGLSELRRTPDTAELGAPGDELPLVTLVHRPAAPQRPPGTTGLFHLALLVPTRDELARSVHRVTRAGHRFTGASDHLVSEALYLDDPEGNGIEIYHDRPREEWELDGAELRMATLPLDLGSVLAGVAAGDVGEGMVVGTRIGHVHLQVSDIPAADAFYVGTLGFDPVVRGYPGALFVSAGGYHHHIGLNTWAGDGAPAAPAGALGLSRFSVVLPDDAALSDVMGSLAAAGLGDGSAEISDPSGNRILLTTP